MKVKVVRGQTATLRSWAAALAAPPACCCEWWGVFAAAVAETPVLTHSDLARGHCSQVMTLRMFVGFASKACLNRQSTHSGRPRALSWSKGAAQSRQGRISFGCFGFLSAI